MKTLPVLFEGYMMLQAIGNDDPVPYLKPLPGAKDFREAYCNFIRPTEVEALGKIGRDHVNYLGDLDGKALAYLTSWEPSAFVKKVAVDYRGDIHTLKDGATITREDVFESAMMDVSDALLASVPRRIEADTDFRGADFQFAVAFVRTYITKPDAHALFDAILDRVESGDAEFKSAFVRWLTPDGGTLVLRDELCRPFKSMFDDRHVEGRQNLAWDNAWTGIDSAKLAYREEFRIGGLKASRRALEEGERNDAGPSV